MVRLLHSKLKKKSRLLLPAILSMFLMSVSSGLFAQGFIEVPVKLDIEKGHLDNGVTIKVQKDGKDAFTQSGSSKMRFKFNYNLSYTLIFMKEGYITKTIEFDTHVPAARIKAGFDPYTIGVKLFPQENDNHKVVYNQAVGRIRYDKTLDEFNYDTDYSKSILSDMQDEKVAEKTTQDSSGNQTAIAQNEEPEKLSAKEEKRNKKKIEEEKAADKKKALQEKKDAEKLAKEMAKETKLQNQPVAEKESKLNNTPVAESDPKVKLQGNKMDESKDMLASTGGAEEGGGLTMEPGADVTQPKVKNAGNDIKKASTIDKGAEKPSAIRQSNSGSEKEDKQLYSANGSDVSSTQQFDENENITREDIVEDKRVITIIKVTKKNVTVEYKRVTYNWGGLYYFLNDKLSISENVFAVNTGVKE